MYIDFAPAVSCIHFITYATALLVLGDILLTVYGKLTK